MAQRHHVAELGAVPLVQDVAAVLQPRGELLVDEACVDESKCQRWKRSSKLGCVRMASSTLVVERRMPFFCRLGADLRLGCRRWAAWQQCQRRRIQNNRQHSPLRRPPAPPRRPARRASVRTPPRREEAARRSHHRARQWAPDRRRQRGQIRSVPEPARLRSRPPRRRRAAPRTPRHTARTCCGGRRLTAKCHRCAARQSAGVSKICSAPSCMASRS